MSVLSHENSYTRILENQIRFEIVRTRFYCEVDSIILIKICEFLFTKTLYNVDVEQIAWN